MAASESETAPMKKQTTIERKSERELVITRTVSGPLRLVYDAWAKPELFIRWWIPKSAPIKLVSYDADIRTGGSYKLVFDVGGGRTLEFFGKYLDVTPNSRPSRSNDEGHEGNQITTVTFEEQGDKTVVAITELYPSKASLDEAIAS